MQPRPNTAKAGGWGEEGFAKRTQWSSGPLRATNAASLSERPGRAERVA